MITKMKKLTALVYHREYEQFLTELQQLGVVHVQPAQKGTVPTDSALQQKNYLQLLGYGSLYS